MYGICVECSHQRGMGNLFRCMNIISWLDEHGYEYILMINDDNRSLKYLDEHNKSYIVVDLWDYDSNWEDKIIRKYGIDVWINDRQTTEYRHSVHVKNSGILLCSFDDTGTGAKLVDYNFCAMVFEKINLLQGKTVLTGSEYMIINKDVLPYRRIRINKERILVTLGGSDTYGVTLKVAKAIKDMPYKFTIVTGYCFDDMDELQNILNGTDIEVKKTVPSLIKLMSEYDLAITGGGVTPFEAMAQGLPCVIIANEPHEEQVGRFFSNNKCAEYLGYYKNINDKDVMVTVDRADVKSMSKKGLEYFKMDGLDNVMRVITNGQ